MRSFRVSKTWDLISPFYSVNLDKLFYLPSFNLLSYEREWCGECRNVPFRSSFQKGIVAQMQGVWLADILPLVCLIF